jgi:ABC-type nitrate/sulfonate/bicarbonate transport system substrate-binding protein
VIPDGVGDAHDLHHLGHAVHTHDVCAGENCGSHRGGRRPVAIAGGLRSGWPVLVDLTKTEFKDPPSCVASSRAFVRKNPNTIGRFLRGYIEAIHVIKTDIELAKRVYAKRYRESDAAVTDKVVRAYAGLFKSVPTVPESGLEVVIRDLASRRPLSKELLQPDAYKDDGPLQKIVAEGWIRNLVNK